MSRGQWAFLWIVFQMALKTGSPGEAPTDQCEPEAALTCQHQLLGIPPSGLSHLMRASLHFLDSCWPFPAQGLLCAAPRRPQAPELPYCSLSGFQEMHTQAIPHPSHLRVLG